MFDSQFTKSQVTSRLSSNLDIPRIAEGTYLHTLIDGIYDVAEGVMDRVDKIAKDLDVYTASEEALEKYGETLGYPRLKQSQITMSSEMGEMYAQVVLYRDTLGLTLPLFTKGQIITSDIYVITFLQDVVFESDRQYNYVDCLVNIRDSFNLSNISMEEGTSIYLPTPNAHTDLIKEIFLVSKVNKLFTREVETVDTYRIRIASLNYASNPISPNSVEGVLATTPGLYSYNIDRSALPYKVYGSTVEMYENNDPSVFNSFCRPYIQSVVSQTKTFGTSYEVIPAESHPFRIDIRTPNAITETTKNALVNSIRSAHSLGSYMLINEPTLQTRLANIMGSPFTGRIDFFYDYRGVSIPTANNEVFVEEHQYPYVLEITVNGV